MYIYIYIYIYITMSQILTPHVKQQKVYYDVPFQLVPWTNPHNS